MYSDIEQKGHCQANGIKYHKCVKARDKSRGIINKIKNLSISTKEAIILFKLSRRVQ